MVQRLLLPATVALLLLAAPGRAEESAPSALEVVASSPGRQWTGVAVTPGGRVFVNYPRWLGPHAHSVAEVLPDGTTRPFPDEAWNAWKPGSDLDVGSHGVCVQSVTCDARGCLWILDPASPAFSGVVPGGAKLVRVDLSPAEVANSTISFDATVAPKAAYLNDVRVDVEREVAFLTDSGLGAIVVVDLKTGKARRLLADHPSTKADPDVVPRIQGRELRAPKPDGTPGDAIRVHADGIALDAKGGWLYWQALTARRLYRAPVAVLADPAKTAEEVAQSVEDLGTTVVTDGMEADAEGNVYFTALEQDAIVVRRPDGRLETLVADPRLAWPDSLAWGPDGSLYVATSQIHRTPMVAGNAAMPETPYLVVRVRLPKR